jgi:hypothetical protein
MNNFDLNKLTNNLSKYYINYRQFIFLYSLNNNLKQLFDNYNDIDNISRNEILYLEDNDFITINKSDNDLIYYSKCSITELGKEVLNTLLISDSDNNNIFVEEWFELWPKGIKSGGYYVKSDKNGCKKNLEKFIKNHPQISKETILKATKKYIDDMKDRNYQYIKLAPYFIYKDNISLLEGYCTNNDIQEENDPFVVKV